MGEAISEIVVVIRKKLVAAEQEVAVTTNVGEEEEKRLGNKMIMSRPCSWQLVRMSDRCQKVKLQN